MAIDDADNTDPRRMFAHYLPLTGYTRRRRMCNSCGHRFTTIETSQEDIEAVALEMQRLREQVEQHKSAMQLILNPRQSS